jgi:hypothetical protein
LNAKFFSLKKFLLVLLVLLFYSFCKYLCISRYGIINKDGVIYSQLAKDFNEKGIREVLNVTFPPLYPAAVGISAPVSQKLYQIFPRAGKFFNVYEFSGIVVSTFFHLLIFLCVYLIGRSFHEGGPVASSGSGDKIAWTAALLMLFHPSTLIFSTSVLSESLFTLLIFCGTYLWLSASEKKTYGKALLSALCFGLSYYVKPEGIFAAFFLFLTTPFILNTGRKYIGQLLFASCVIFLLMAPYIYFLYSQTGHLMISNKQNIVFFLSAKKMFPDMNFGEPFGAVSFLLSYPGLALRKFLSGLVFVIERIPETLSVPYLFLFIFLVLSREKTPPARKCARWVVVLFYLAIAFYNPDKRYLVPFIPLLSFDIASGFFCFRGWLSRKTGKDLLIPLILFLSLTAAVETYPARDDLKECIKKIGLHIGEGKKNMAIASNDTRYAFYAEGRHVSLQDFFAETQAKESPWPDILILNNAEDKSYISLLKNRQELLLYFPHSKYLELYGIGFVIYSREPFPTGL